MIGETGLIEAPKDDGKANLLAALRATLRDGACRWLDAAVALTADGPRYPPILGTGGNDGRLDFSNNFMQRVVDAFGSQDASLDLLRSSLVGFPTSKRAKGAVGQFSPGTAGGLNAGIGFSAEARINPWDFILTIEGALVFAAAAARRHGQDRAGTLAFPFCTRMVGAGSGASAESDEADARAEFWAPLWSRPITLPEMRVLMAEGRAVLNGANAKDGLDFARAVGQLGIARGVEKFQRHGFLMRAGKAYFATPLHRVGVREDTDASLITDLDRNGWLAIARRTVRDKTAPAVVGSLGHTFEDALFRLAGDKSQQAVEEALVAFGASVCEIGRRPKLREGVPPPPRLSKEWVEAADDGSHEFAV